MSATTDQNESNRLHWRTIRLTADIPAVRLPLSRTSCREPNRIRSAEQLGFINDYSQLQPGNTNRRPDTDSLPRGKYIAVMFQNKKSASDAASERLQNARIPFS